MPSLIHTCNNGPYKRIAATQLRRSHLLGEWYMTVKQWALVLCLVEMHSPLGTVNYTVGQDHLHYICIGRMLLLNIVMLSVVGTEHNDGTMITATVDGKVVTYTHQTVDLQQPRDYSAKSLGDLRFKAWGWIFFLL